MPDNQSTYPANNYTTTVKLKTHIDNKNIYTVNQKTLPDDQKTHPVNQKTLPDDQKTLYFSKKMKIIENKLNFDAAIQLFDAVIPRVNPWVALFDM